MGSPLPLEEQPRMTLRSQHLPRRAISVKLDHKKPSNAIDWDGEDDEVVWTLTLRTQVRTTLLFSCYGIDLLMRRRWPDASVELTQRSSARETVRRLKSRFF